MHSVTFGSQRRASFSLGNGSDRNRCGAKGTSGSKTTVLLVVVPFPARSVAVTPIEFAPGTNGIEHEKVNSLMVAWTPLQVTPATPESESETEPAMVIWALLTIDPSDGLVTVKVGGVMSRLRVTLVV